MSVSIVTGYTGMRHITPNLDAAVNRGIFGAEDCILATGNHLAASMPSINSFVMQDGAVSIQGHIAVSTGDTLAVDTCATGSNRIDYVVARFTHNTTTLIDNVEILLIKGTETTSSNPTTPTYNTGDIASGATVVDMPLYRIDLSGSTVTFTQLAIVRGFLTDYEMDALALKQTEDAVPVGFRAKRTDTDVEVGLEVGEGGNNHGVWSGTYNKFLVNYDKDGYSRIDGKYIAQNNVLWSGGSRGSTMHAEQTVNLSQKVSDQASGIVLCWSGYDYVTGTFYDHNFVYTFVPKWHVTLHGGAGVSIPLFWGYLSHVGNKYVYVYDTRIVGNDNNKTHGTANGITYDNRYWVLRAVIGV